jgi:hypothetical protein
MLVFGGKDNVLVKKEKVIDKCQNCGGTDCMEIKVLRLYLHIFFIPIVPYDRFVYNTCYKCNHQLALENMPIDLAARAAQLKKESRTPIWLFTGPIIFSVIFILFSYLLISAEKKNKIQIRQMNVSDVFRITTGNNKYCLMVVKKITKDSIFSILNNSNTLQSINDSVFEKQIDTFGFSKKQIEEGVYFGSIQLENEK